MSAARPYIGAIETHYKGYRFRSRLEARWAVFFDSLKYEWQYEPEGFEVRYGPDAADVHRYLPDFYLPKFKTWAEVKGSDDALRQDMPRVEAVVGSGALGNPCRLFFLGQIPDRSYITIKQKILVYRDGSLKHCEGSIRDNSSDERVAAAYDAARSARFEYGENALYVDRRGFGIVPGGLV